LSRDPMQRRVCTSPTASGGTHRLGSYSPSSRRVCLSLPWCEIRAAGGNVVDASSECNSARLEPRPHPAGLSLSCPQRPHRHAQTRDATISRHHRGSCRYDAGRNT
jgi:hypothetical protein